MKTKIVAHIAGNALFAIRDAQGEAANMRDKYADVLFDKQKGAGLDFAVLREKLDEAERLLDLLT